VNYPTLTDGAVRFIDTLTQGIHKRYSTIAKAFSSSGVSPAFHRESPSFNIAIAEATSLSNVELKEGHVMRTPVLQAQLHLVITVRAYTCGLHESTHLNRGASLPLQGVADSPYRGLLDLFAEWLLPRVYAIALEDHVRVIVGHMASYLVCGVPLYVVLFLELLLDPQEEFIPVHSRFSASEEVVEPPHALAHGY